MHGIRSITNPESIAAYGEVEEVGEIWECIEPVVVLHRVDKCRFREADVEIPQAVWREGHGPEEAAAVAEGMEA
jgi:hypothetical protein